MKELTEDQIRCLKILVEHAREDDKHVRERMIRLWRKLKLFWDGFQHIWFSEVAHDWRVDDNTSDQFTGYYDKPINVFRAYLESIIAALSISIPGIKCFPDDAENVLDVQTARAADKIAQLIYKHNDVSLLWLHALYIFFTEGLVAAYTYPKSSSEYGEYEENQYETFSELISYGVCPQCESRIIEDNYCVKCMMEVDSPLLKEEQVENERLVGVTKHPKSRQCIEAHGGLFVKVPVWARTQEECPYLLYEHETHYSNVLHRYPKLRDKIDTSSTSRGADFYEKWGRVSNQYFGDEPDNLVSECNAWIRPSLYEILDEKDAKNMHKLFPKGVKITIFNNDHFAEAEEDELDKCWTLSKNPLSDYLHHEPTGQLLISTQEITNDLISLVLQTIEHGIPQTFADPAVLDFDLYTKTEVQPGNVFPAVPRGGRPISDFFYEVKTATLSREVQPFFEKLHELGQLVSGALPSLFGGAAPNSSKTAAQYAMSRQQALQRQQTTWKMFTVWWKQVFSKVIPQYIRMVIVDEKSVEQDMMGNFINVVIRKSELQGKIGRIELEGGERMPSTWLQKRETLMELLQQGNPAVIQAIALPENLQLLNEMMGLEDLNLPNQIDVEKQYEEIQLLLQSQPVMSEMGETPSVTIEPEVDNHQVEIEICKRWIKSIAGRQSKTDNPMGYRNVLLHLQQHTMYMQQQMQENLQLQMMMQSQPARKEPSNGSTRNKGQQPGSRVEQQPTGIQ